MLHDVNVDSAVISFASLSSALMAVRRCVEGVEVVARLGDGHPIAVRSGNLFATAFHPELTDDTRVHEYFVEMAKESVRTRAAG